MLSRNFISKCLVGFIRFLQRINEKFTDNSFNPNPDFFEELTPSYLNLKEAKGYIDTINWAVLNPEVKNIALTGSYGSGKSSILKTFEKKYSEFCYLNVSLASFDDEGEVGDELRKKIEISILQQIFYKVSTRKVPFSRFRRIKNTPWWHFLSYALLICGWLLSLAILIKLGFLKEIDWLVKLYNPNKQIVLNISVVAFLIGTLTLIYKISKNYSTARFNKLNITSGEFELSQDTDNSILNKHLDEILYFFEETKYNVIVIEDLDRFKDPEIFTKLRELNILINSSSQIHRKVTFIYALKDDIFKDANRAKFFDFLLPVIPVINASNSGEKLIKKFDDAKNKGKLTNNFISDITLFVDDMRMLKNIYNEYILYKKRIGLKVIEEKLLGIIVYKNFYPTDFAELNVQKGLVYNAFKYKFKLISQLQAENKEKISGLQNRNEIIEAEFIKNIEELRAIYTMAFVSKIQAEVIRIQPNAGGDYTIDQLSSDDFFTNLQNSTSFQYVKGGAYARWETFRLSFKTIEDEIDPKNSYSSRLQSIEARLNGEIDSNRRDIQELQKINANIQSWTLEQVLAKSKEKLSDDIHQEPLLNYLLTRGYIDEMYNAYISYFYEGTITRSDMDFVVSVKTANPIEFEYQLSKIDQVVKRLNISEYSQKAVFNVSLLDFLAKNKNSYKEPFNAIIAQMANRFEKDNSFLDTYLKKGTMISIVTKAIFHEWPGLWEALRFSGVYGDEEINNHLKLLITHADVADIVTANTNNAVANALAEKADFIQFVHGIDIKKIKDIIEKLEIEFVDLEYSETEDEVFNFIYNNSHYELSSNMIEKILSVKGEKISDLEYQLRHKNYSTILSSKCTPLINYVMTNIDYYLSDIFFALPENTDEEEQFLLQLLNNEKISEEDKKAIIEKEKVKFSDIESIPNEIWNELIRLNKVSPSWKNLLTYFKDEQKSDELLSNYLNESINYQVLSKSFIGKTTGDDRESTTQMAVWVILNDSLNNEAYRTLIKSDPFNWNNLSVEKISAEKVDILIAVGKLNFTKNNYDKLKANFEGKNITLLLNKYSGYLTSTEEFIFDTADYLLLLNSTKITSAQKISLIKKMPTDFLFNEALADLTSQTLINANATVSFDLFKKLIQKNSTYEIDVPLFVIHYQEFEKSQKVEILEIMGKEFKKLLTKRSRTTFDYDDHTLQLVEFLKNDAIVSSYKFNKKDIVVFAKHK